MFPAYVRYLFSVCCTEFCAYPDIFILDFHSRNARERFTFIFFFLLPFTENYIRRHKMETSLVILAEKVFPRCREDIEHDDVRYP